MPDITSSLLDSIKKHRQLCYFLCIFVPLATLAIVCSFFCYRADISKHEILLHEKARHDTSLARNLIGGIVISSVKDLHFLANLQETRKALTGLPTDVQPQIFNAFSDTKRSYDQIRVLDASGQERLRINRTKQGVTCVPADQLQNKADRYYFRETMKLNPGQVYISPFDLNKEHGQIEIPYKPMIRFSTPLEDEQGNTIGIVILNFLGQPILEALTEASNGGDGTLMLLNEEGYWLKSPLTTDEWGFMFADGKDKTFQSLFPSEWDTISTTRRSAIQTENGFFGHYTLQLETLCKKVSKNKACHELNRRWFIVTHIPPEVLAQKALEIRTDLATTVLPALAILAFLVYFLTRFLHGNKLAEEELIAQSITFERFIPKEFLTLMGKGSLLDVRRSQSTQHDLTVLFSDIRSYTKLSEGMTPHDLFRFLNDYFTQVGIPISENNGFIDKYIGDAIMALFAGSPEDALLAAIGIQQGLSEFSAQSPLLQGKNIRAGFGINYGNVTLGSVGTKERQQTTIIGDTVNLASRLESATKIFQVDIVFSDSVYHALPDPGRFMIREIDTVRVKGKNEPVTLYEAFDASPSDVIQQKQQMMPTYMKALGHYKSGEFAEAIELFKACKMICPTDGICDLYIKRSNTMLRIPPGPNWAGISTL